MKIHLLMAAHFSVPGIITKVFADLPGAEAEAMDLTNLMLSDNGQAKSANASNWRAKVEALQDEHGAAHCYVEIAEHVVVGAVPDPVRDAGADTLAALRRLREVVRDRMRIHGDAVQWAQTALAEADVAIAKAEGRAS